MCSRVCVPTGSVLLLGSSNDLDDRDLEDVASPDAINATQLLENVTAGVQLSTDRGSLLWSIPKCSPVILWTHNRIECVVVPWRSPRVGVSPPRVARPCRDPLLRAVQGAIALDVVWTRTNGWLPGVYYDSHDEAQYPPVLTAAELSTLNERAISLSLHVGGVYYPNQVITFHSGAAPTQAASLLLAAAAAVCFLLLLA